MTIKDIARESGYAVGTVSRVLNNHPDVSEVDIPCVMVTNPADSLTFLNLSSVSIDDKEAARTVIRHLASLGHQNIGILGGEMKYSNPAKARYEGCLDAFEELNVAFDIEKNFEASKFTMEGGYHAMLKLLNKTPNITAVFAMLDVMALGAIRAIKDMDYRVPDDISARNRIGKTLC